MTIASICQRRVDTALPTEIVQTAAQRMATRCVGTLVVVDVHDRPIGMLTDRDLALRVVGAGDHPRGITVADVMTGHVEVVREDASIETALARMRQEAVRRLPVVDADGRMVGIVSLEDVLALLAREMAAVGEFLQRTSPTRLAAE
ncbi:MAG: CBS domain-containing protein [Planctomycetes bacterium]|nr:CBS domain-containing protein [Planctomycetota bacterium]